MKGVLQKCAAELGTSEVKERLENTYWFAVFYSDGLVFGLFCVFVSVKMYDGK